MRGGGAGRVRACEGRVKRGGWGRAGEGGEGELGREQERVRQRVGECMGGVG